METINLELLTEKIYREAIEKAENEAASIIKDAEDKAKQLITKAEQEAELNILAKAKNEAKLLKSSTESELQLVAKRLISDLKREIAQLISDKILVHNIKGVFLNPEFFKEIILEIVKHWGKEDVIELHLAASTKNKIDKGFNREIARHVKNLTVTFDEKIKGGFRISKKEDSYQISFTDEDFIAFFHSYLSQKTQQLLFNGKK